MSRARPSASTNWQRAVGSTVPGAAPWRPEPDRYHRQVSLAVVGDMGCGKTTLSIRFCSGVFIPVPGTVGFDFHVRTVEARDGRRVQVRVWDTAGQERHRALVPVLFRGVHGCLLVYDCTRADTFASATAWADALLEMTRLPVPRVLVGNKTDEVDLREVTQEEGAALARDLGVVRFFETSAKDGSNVEAAFLSLVDAVLGVGDEPCAADSSALRLPLGEEKDSPSKGWCGC